MGGLRSEFSVNFPEEFPIAYSVEVDQGIRTMSISQTGHADHLFQA
jgi:hypothetical protein